MVEAVTSSFGEDPRVEKAPGGESSDGSDDMHRELGQALTSKRSFAAAVRKQQCRVLSRLLWEETPIMVEAVRYLFYSSDLLLAAFDLSQNAGLVQLWGEELGVGVDGSTLRADMLDTYIFLMGERPVRRVHGSLSFVFGMQLFIDETVMSWCGAHYVYPIRARVLNVRDRRAQWVTVAYVLHVGKPAARTTTTRRRASDARNGLVQQCLAVLLLNFVGASLTGVTVEFSGPQALTAVPLLVGIVAATASCDR